MTSKAEADAVKARAKALLAEGRPVEEVALLVGRVAKTIRKWIAVEEWHDVVTEGLRGEAERSLEGDWADRRDAEIEALAELVERVRGRITEIVPRVGDRIRDETITIDGQDRVVSVVSKGVIDVEGKTLRDLVVALAILYDKGELLAGRATERVEVLTDESTVDAEIRRLSSEIEEMSDGPPT